MRTRYLGNSGIEASAGFIERREAIRADYQTFTGRISEYDLHPYHLLAYHGNWYVLARNTEKDLVETFALSRFRRIEAVGAIFTRPATFCPETYARQAFGIVGGEAPIKIRTETAVSSLPRPRGERNLSAGFCLGCRT